MSNTCGSPHNTSFERTSTLRVFAAQLDIRYAARGELDEAHVQVLRIQDA